MKKAHALHNEETCRFLLSGKKYNDWVVTTAFYSALHFVQNEMFPLVEEKINYENFNQYYSKVLKNQNKRLTKHTGTILLVKKKLPACSSHYRWLHDACMNARYAEYKVSDEKAQTAFKFLTELKRHLRK